MPVLVSAAGRCWPKKKRIGSDLLRGGVSGPVTDAAAAKPGRDLLGGSGWNITFPSTPAPVANTQKRPNLLDITPPRKPAPPKRSLLADVHPPSPKAKADPVKAGALDDPARTVADQVRNARAIQKRAEEKRAAAAKPRRDLLDITPPRKPARSLLDDVHPPSPKSKPAPKPATITNKPKAWKGPNLLDVGFAGFGVPKAKAPIPNREDWAMETALQIRNLRMNYNPFNKDMMEELEALEKRRANIKKTDPELHDRMMEKIEAVEWGEENSIEQYQKIRKEIKTALTIFQMSYKALKKGIRIPFIVIGPREQYLMDDKIEKDIDGGA